MRRRYLIILIFLSILSGCKKTETTRTSGTDTIESTIYQNSQSYYAFGFSFSKAKKISNLLNPGPDITLVINNDNTVSRLTLQSNNLDPSFYKVGDYQDETSAISAFKNLKTVNTSAWQDMADPINANQVWIYKSGDGYYTKFRIVSIINEIRNNLAYGECTFEWLYQPDGSSTFPGK
jgi:hypothetical protein